LWDSIRAFRVAQEQTRFILTEELGAKMELEIEKSASLTKIILLRACWNVKRLHVCINEKKEGRESRLKRFVDDE
jgi:hypothetical protein